MHVGFTPDGHTTVDSTVDAEFAPFMTLHPTHLQS